MLYTQSLPTYVFFIIRAVFIAAQLAVNFTTAKVQTFNIKKRMILQHWEPSCRMALWQSPDSCCHGLTGMSAILPLKKGKESFASVWPLYQSRVNIAGLDCQTMIYGIYTFNVTLSRHCPKMLAGNSPNKIVSGEWNKSHRRVNREKNIGKPHS